MIGDKVQAEYYGRRFDGVDLYRYAVPNIRISPKPMGESISEDEEKYWQKPKFKVLQYPSEQEFGCAIDVENKGFTYTETDIPVDDEEEPTGDLTLTDTLEMLNKLGVDTND
jgi:hypothetical protein